MKNIKREDLKNMKRGLLVVDVINGFVSEGNMAVKGGERIIPENERLVQGFLEDEESFVGFFRDSHPKNTTEFGKFPSHCIEGTSESELVDELRKYEGYGITYLKNSRSGLFAPHFIDDMKALENIEEIVVTGLCTDKCVMDTAIPLVNLFDELNKDVKIYVPRNAVETYDAPNHNREEYNEWAFRFMEEEGIKVVKKYEMRRGK